MTHPPQGGPPHGRWPQGPAQAGQQWAQGPAQQGGQWPPGPVQHQRWPGQQQYAGATRASARVGGGMALVRMAAALVLVCGVGMLVFGPGISQVWSGHVPDYRMVEPFCDALGGLASVAGSILLFAGRSSGGPLACLGAGSALIDGSAGAVLLFTLSGDRVVGIFGIAQLLFGLTVITLLCLRRTRAALPSGAGKTPAFAPAALGGVLIALAITAGLFELLNAEPGRAIVYTVLLVGAVCGAVLLILRFRTGPPLAAAGAGISLILSGPIAVTLWMELNGLLATLVGCVLVFASVVTGGLIALPGVQRAVDARRRPAKQPHPAQWTQQQWPQQQWAQQQSAQQQWVQQQWTQQQWPQQGLPQQPGPQHPGPQQHPGGFPPR